ncbi:MAG TPA: DsbA family protein [Mycobacteriales bacterium]
MSLIMYADVSSPECYLASRRTDALSAAQVRVDWRAVEQAPRLPVAGERLSDTGRETLADRLDAVDRLLLDHETLPRLLPQFRPNTLASVSALAEVYDSAVADDVRRLLFSLYWQDGLDVGSPEVLRRPLAGAILRSGSPGDALLESGYAVTMNRGPVTVEAYRRVRAWRTEWAALGNLELPVVLTGGATLSGPDALRRLGKEVAYAQADVEPSLPDPRRYPPVADRPPGGWVSETGGRWRRTYRTTGAR